jgi:hypothetical protein
MVSDTEREKGTMRTQQTHCGYDGHYCGIGRTFFISRYRGINDYCVDGVRVSVSDDGQAHTFDGVTPEQIERIRLFELGKYAEYCEWHSKLDASDKVIAPLQAFQFQIQA